MLAGFTLLNPYQRPYLLLALLLILPGTAVAFKVWERPALGLAGAVLLMAVPWHTGEEGEGLVHVTLSDLAVVFLVGIIAVRTLVIGDQGRLRSWILLPLAGVVVAGSAATLTASDPVTSISGLVRYTELFVVVPLATYLALESRRDLKLNLAVIIAIGLLEGAIGVYQFLTETGAGFGVEGNIRAIGTFGAYDISGLAAIVTYALVGATATFAGLRDRRRWWVLLLMLALVFPLVFSLSRGAWISAAVGVLTVVALNNWKKAALVVLVGGLAITMASGIIIGSSDVAAERFASIYSATSDPDQSVGDRYAMWQAARDMWVEHPLTGVGLKNFSHFRDVYTPLSFSGSSDISDLEGGFQRVALLTPHNLYYLILSEQGLVGIFAYSILFLSLGIAAFKNFSKTEEHSIQRIFALFSLGFLASYLTARVYGDVGGGTMVLDTLFGGVLWLASGKQMSEEPDEELSETHLRTTTS
ncbi:MAG: O-antigen ligase family protein [Rubrobacter sp.]|nr:O-antigen ligase family protein [Rubrobacter sp.]